MNSPKILILQQNSRGDSIFALDPQYRALYELANSVNKPAFRFSRCEFQRCVMDGKLARTCRRCQYNHGEAVVFLF